MEMESPDEWFFPGETYHVTCAATHGFPAPTYTWEWQPCTGALEISLYRKHKDANTQRKKPTLNSPALFAPSATLTRHLPDYFQEWAAPLQKTTGSLWSLPVETPL